MRKGKSYLAFLAGMCVILAVAGVYAVQSGLVFTLTKFKGGFAIVGIFLTYTSSFVGIRGYTDQSLTQKERLVVICGGLSGGFAGLAAFCYALYPGTISEKFWWVSYMLVILAFVSFQVAVVFAALSLKR